MKAHQQKVNMGKEAFHDELSKIARTTEDKALPSGISGLKKDVRLYEHQNQAINKVLDRSGSLLLSHGTGSGKTLTSIAAFEKMRDQGLATTALVVTPASLRVNFIDNGVRKFTNARASLLGTKEEAEKGIARSLDDPDRGARYHVIGYEMFSKDPKKAIEATGADTVIYDELHRIRNESGVTYKTIKDARKLHKNFIGLTGSLMNNTPADLVPLVDAMTDGQHRLGSKAQFERRFVKEDSKTKERTVARPYVVKALLSPFVDHFETKDMGDERMPKKIVEDVKVMMTPRQEELYRFVVNKLDPIMALKFRLGVTKLKTRDVNNIFSKIIQARQVSNAIHTIDLDTSLSDSAKKSPKVSKLLDDVEEHLKETPDGQAVVHSNLIRGGVDVLSQGLKDRGIPYAIFTGKGQPGMTEEKRQQAVTDFNSGKKRVIVISAAGGEGLDLRNATLFAGLDGHFNPEKVNQAESRAVRAGGLAHRAPEDRQVIVKRYSSVVPRSTTQTAKDVLQLISVSGFINRLSDPNMPLFFNPFKREQSPDEWMSDIAKKKDVLNEAFRHQLKTSSADEYVDAEDYLEKMSSWVENGVLAQAFNDELTKIGADASTQKIPFQPFKYIKSDKHIMDNYWKEFGAQIESMTDPYAGELKSKRDQLVEQRHIDALRVYYRGAAKGQGTPPKGITTDKDVVIQRIKGALGLTALGALYGGSMVLSKDPGVRPLKAFGVGAGIGAGVGALIAGPTAYWSLKSPYFTTQKTKARKAVQLEDPDLRAMLRGLSVKKEEIKETEHFIA